MFGIVSIMLYLGHRYNKETVMVVIRHWSIEDGTSRDGVITNLKGGTADQWLKNGRKVLLFYPKYKLYRTNLVDNKLVKKLLLKYDHLSSGGMIEHNI